jgi:hypothetical protein
VDRIAPTIIINGKQQYNHIRYKPYNDLGFRVRDNFYDSAQLTVTSDVSEVINHKPGNYNVYYTATDKSGNKASATRVVNVSESGEVGIAEHDKSSNLSVYPNPTKGKLNLAWGDKEVSSIKVYTIIGTLVYETPVSNNISETQIDLSNLKDGVYIIRLEANGTTLMKKVNLVK